MELEPQTLSATSEWRHWRPARASTTGNDREADLWTLAKTPCCPRSFIRVPLRPPPTAGFGAVRSITSVYSIPIDRLTSSLQWNAFFFSNVKFSMQSGPISTRACCNHGWGICTCARAHRASVSQERLGRLCSKFRVAESESESPGVVVTTN